MLSEAVLNSIGRKRAGTPAHGFSITAISPCAYETYLNWRSRLDERETRGVSLADLTMDDGHYQEMASLSWLQQAGFTLAYTGNIQLTVHVGESLIPGHPDGLILTPGVDLLEIKAMNYDRFSKARKGGLREHPRIMCQIQSYMHSYELRALGIGRAQMFCKHKETARLCDFQVDYAPEWIGPIIQTTDRIVRGELVPEPKECAECNDCYKYSICWENGLLESGESATMSAPDIEAQYARGEELFDQGKYLKDDAKDKMIALMGDKWDLYFDMYKISKIEFPRASFDQGMFIDLYGADNLGKVMAVKTVQQYKVSHRKGA
jgi:hypothetical protein